MAIPEFNVQEQWIGNDTLADYTFDFTIHALSHLLIIVQDQNGELVYSVRGDDVSYLAGVVFDSVEGGGTITLQGVLPNQWVITALSANDAPSQPFEFKDKFSFTLERFEKALDYMMSAIQRVAWLAQRSIRVNDTFTDTFDAQLPATLVPNAFLKVKSTGDGIDFGPTEDGLVEQVNSAAANALASEVIAAQAAADAIAQEASAATAAANALNAATGAQSSASSAAASAALASTFTSGIVHRGPFADIPANTNANLLGEVTSHTAFTMVEYKARILRGTTVFARQDFTIFYRNGAWELNLEGDSYADLAADHGVTFTVDPTTAQINAAVANDGGSNAIIDFNKIQWAV